MADSPETTPNILIVDDDPLMIRLLGRMLSSLGHVRFAMNGEDALRLIRTSEPDAVVLDAEMPGLSGVGLCRVIKEDLQLENVPVIFVTGNCEPAFEVTCFQLGAVDYVQKPVHAPVLHARLQTHIRLKRMSDQLRRNASLDPLTELANRRVFDDTLDHEWRRALRNGQALSLLLVDIDHFKAFNDHYGHPAGDRCLRAFTETLRRIAVRATDLVARYGGEEFAVLLPETPLAGARAVGDRLLKLLEQAAIPHARSPVATHVTASVGISTFEPDGASVTRRSEPPRAPSLGSAELLELADRALYDAKLGGRSRVSFLPCAPGLGFRHA